MSTTEVLLISNRAKRDWPSKDVLRAFKGNFGGLVIPELQYGFPNKVLFTPGYVVENYRTRKIIRSRYRESGLLHFPINLYNTTPIYHNYYPDWDDKDINTYLSELLNDGLIPVGSAFADNIKIVKPVVDPSLVPIVFVGWENPWPIIRPAEDADNLFYVAKSYFPKSLVYWHNPSGQGAPYYYAPDWGYPVGTELNHIVWDYIVNVSGCQGLLAQNNGWENDGINSVNRLQDFAWRFKGNNGWPVCDLVDFEEVVYYNTTMQGNPLMTGQFIREQVPDLKGFCNG